MTQTQEDNILRYPFTPKSTTYMKPGQFWPIRLKNGQFACGRVLQVARQHGERSTKGFIAGLMDWSGDDEPTSNDLVGVQILEFGGAHIKAITHTGAKISGIRELRTDGLVIPLRLDQSPGQNCHIRQGYDVLRFASHEEQSTLRAFSTWGFKVINNLAEKHFANTNVANPYRE